MHHSSQVNESPAVSQTNTSTISSRLRHARRRRAGGWRRCRLLASRRRGRILCPSPVSSSVGRMKSKRFWITFRAGTGRPVSRLTRSGVQPLTGGPSVGSRQHFGTHLGAGLVSEGALVALAHGGASETGQHLGLDLFPQSSARPVPVHLYLRGTRPGSSD